MEGIDNFKVRNKRSASSVDDRADQETEEEEEVEGEMGNEEQEQGFMYSEWSCKHSECQVPPSCTDKCSRDQCQNLHMLTT